MTSPLRFAAGHREPTPEDLASIEIEWPLIEAEMAVVDAQIRILCAGAGATALDWRRLRRAEAQVLREAAALTGGGQQQLRGRGCGWAA